MTSVEIQRKFENIAGQLSCEAPLRRDRYYLKYSRIQDVVLSAAGLVILMPLMLIVALFIRIDSPGASPIFRQTRVGRDGKPFTLYKFRTMCPDAEQRLDGLLQYNEMDGPVFKIRDDPRITRIGRFLRRSFVDELPQLWNVLRGDMSLVGPRPGLPREVEQYSSNARQRLIVKPGLTCYWQIQPDHNKLPFDSWVEMDLRYIQERSFFTDWKIIWKTVGVILTMQGE